MAAYELIVIGASLGGMRALQAIFCKLPAGFQIPVAVVLHRGVSSEESWCAVLQPYSAFPIEEAYDKQLISVGHIYVAPANYHLLIEPGHFALSTEAPVHSARPSIDVLFESAADSYGSAVIGVILTGGSEDGAQGLAAIKQHGGIAVVQDPATAEGHVMPAAAIAATAVDHILPLQDIGPLFQCLCQQGQ